MVQILVLRLVLGLGLGLGLSLGLYLGLGYGLGLGLGLGLNVNVDDDGVVRGLSFIYPVAGWPGGGARKEVAGGGELLPEVFIWRCNILEVIKRER